MATEPVTGAPTPAFGGFIGNAATAKLLRGAVLAGRLAHAYLLTGPASVGKRTLAHTLAATLVCARYPAQTAPCGVCRPCQLVKKHTHPDVRAIEPEPGRRGVSIDQIRLVEHAAGLRPYEGEWKVFILRGADTMPEPAANALLKTLEEPPEDTVLVLTAADGSQVLPTIASRCREVPLRPVPAAEIAGALRMRGADPETAERLGRLAGGRPGWALSALAHPALAEALGETLDQLEALLAQPHVTRLTAAGSMGDAAAADAALDLWLTWWRDALLVQQGCPELVVHRERLESLRRLGAPPAVIWRALSRIQETRQQLAANVNVRLAVEALLLDLPDPASPS